MPEPTPDDPLAVLDDDLLLDDLGSGVPSLFGDALGDLGECDAELSEVLLWWRYTAEAKMPDLGPIGRAA